MGGRGRFEAHRATISTVERFDVYGRLVVEAEYDGERWVLWSRGADGTRSRLHDVPVPPNTTADELPRFLEDVFHEYGAPGRLVTRLDDPA